MPAPALTRFWACVSPEPNSGCWLWDGYGDREDYGQIRVNGKLIQAHRFSYEIHVGAIPGGLQLDHLCRVHCCVNPAHLEPVTHKENAMRGVGLGAINAAKVICQHGHEFTEANTYIRSNGHRDCRACIRERVRRYQLRSAA